MMIMIMMIMIMMIMMMIIVGMIMMMIIVAMIMITVIDDADHLLLLIFVIQLPDVAYFFGLRPSKDSSTLPGRRLRGMATGWHK